MRSWIDAINKLDIEAVTSLYAEDAVLIPTFSPHTLRTNETRRKYLENLMRLKGLSVSLHEKTLIAQVLGGGIEILSGIYRFHVEVDEEPLVFEARFSYVIDARLPRPILQHHSSQIPRTLS